jgi:hypothetical protein
MFPIAVSSVVLTLEQLSYCEKSDKTAHFIVDLPDTCVDASCLFGCH